MNKYLLQLIPKKMYPQLLVYKIIISIFNVAISYLMKLALESIYGSKININYIFLLFIVLTIVYSVVYYIYNITLEIVRKIIVEKLTLRITKNFLATKNLEISSGKLLNIINDDVQVVGNYLIYGIFPLIDFILMLTFGIIYVSYLSLEAGLFYIGVGIIFLLIATYNYLRATKERENYQQLDDVHKNYYTDVVKNIPLLKVLFLHKWLREKHQIFYNNKVKNYKNMAKSLAMSDAIFSGGIFLVEIVTLILGFIFVYQKQMTLVAMISIWNAGIGSIMYIFLDLSSIGSYVVKQQVSIKRLEKYVFTKDEIAIKNNTKVNEKNKIIVNNINFSYTNKNIINNFNCEIRKDKINYIVGRNGAGKTTVMKILLRLLYVDKGAISPKNYTVAYVPQKNELFNMSILENITLGRKYSIKNLEIILKKLAMWDVIEKLPNKLETIIDENNNFSKGQIRRLMIARALIGKVDYIFLDEPLSDIDESNQKNVMSLLQDVVRNGTGVVIISHESKFITKDDNIINVGG